VELVGNADSLDRAFKKAGHSAKSFHADLGKATRGALSGSGLLHHAGRSLAFASGGFLASASIGEAFTSSILAATEAAATQRQMAAQLKATGLSFKQYREQIDQTNLSESELSGFTKEELDKSFTTIVRGTGNVSLALKDVAIAADIARGTHRSLATVSLAVGKAAAGSTTSLKRLGIQLPKGASGTQAIALAQKKFAGQAAAGATAMNHLAAAINNAQIIIGTSMLPTVNRLIKSGTHWLTQMEKSGALQRDVASASQFLGDALHGVRAIVIPVGNGFRRFQHAVGGTRHAVEILGATFVAWKIAGVAAKVATITKAFRGLAIAEEAAALAGQSLPHVPKVPPVVTKPSKLANLGKLARAGAVLAAPIEALTLGERNQGDLTKTKQLGSSMQQIGRAVFQDKSGHYFQQRGIGRGIGMVPITKHRAVELGAIVPHARPVIHIEHFHSHAKDTDKLWSELEKVGKRRGQRRGTR
jgi:hypothetical protein